MEFASRKDTAAALDALKKVDIRAHYANVSEGTSGIRAKVADLAFESFRKAQQQACQKRVEPEAGKVSDLVSKLEAAIASPSHPVVDKETVPAPICQPKSPEVASKPVVSQSSVRSDPMTSTTANGVNNKMAIAAADTKMLIGQLVVVLMQVDDACKTCETDGGPEHMHYVLSDQILLPARDAPPALQDVTCGHCGSQSQLKKCAGCEKTSYCSKSCQSKDWLKHKPGCSGSSPTASSAAGTPASVRMAAMSLQSPNGTLEDITAPLSNGSRGPKPTLAHNLNGFERLAIRRTIENPAARKQADVTDGETPVRQTAVTRTRIEEPPSSGAPEKKTAAQTIKEMYASPPITPNQSLITPNDDGEIRSMASHRKHMNAELPEEGPMTAGQKMRAMMTQPITPKDSGDNCPTSPPRPKVSALPPKTPGARRASGTVSPTDTALSAGPASVSPKSPAVVKKVTRKLVMNEKQKALVVYRDEVDDRFWYVSGDEDTIYNLINPEIMKATESADFCPTVGAYVLARSTADDEFYRAFVTAIRGNQCLVYFIDYGNIDNVRVADTKRLPAVIHPVTGSYPPQAVKVKLSDSGLTEHVKRHYDGGIELKFKPIKDRGDYYVIEV